MNKRRLLTIILPLAFLSLVACNAGDCFCTHSAAEKARQAESAPITLPLPGEFADTPANRCLEAPIDLPGHPLSPEQKAAALKICEMAKKALAAEKPIAKLSPPLQSTDRVAMAWEQQAR